jgi:photosystem II stability/assembly factor-like uncharacterized protein
MTLRNALVTICTLALFGASVRPDATSAALEFRSIGPLDGRVDAVAGVAGDPTTYYAGAEGGLFKSRDGGATWTSIFNDRPVSSVGAIAVAPSRAATLYIGTGATDLRNDVAFGDGVWRSDDAGLTWSHTGLDATGHIAAIAIDPDDSDRAFVAALGNVFKPSTARGIYRTTDGGRTWQHVLYTTDRTGGSSVAIDPLHPNVIFAGMWEGWRSPYHLTSGGPTDGIYESTDGGDHWRRLAGDGLPSGVVGRIAIAFAPSDPQRIYALVESRQGLLWRSDDGGTHWKMVNASHGIDQRPFYFTSLTVDPKDRDHVYFMSVEIWESSDGGKTATPMEHLRAGDFHQLWIDPANPARMIAGADDGADVSMDAGETWLPAPVAISQPYHVSVDDRVPYTICMENQDEGGDCGAGNSLMAGGIPPNEFFAAGGGESGWIVIDQADPNLIYADSYDGSLTQFDRRTGQARRIDVWPEDAMGWPAASLRYRFQWTAPLAMSPQHPHRLYMGGNRIFQTDDGGVTWRAISPDLTRDDKGRQHVSGTPITPDNTSVEYYDVVFCIGPSPLRNGEIWAGTDDGFVWLTLDGGLHWTNVTPRVFAAVPDGHWLRVDYVAPSPFDAATAYIAADAHKWGDRRPHLFVTHDFGRTWRSIAKTLPQNSYTRMIRPDPFRRGMIYAGTETGLWYSYDDGAQWIRLEDGLPVAPIYDFAIQPRFDDLVVATHGRGVWILDDLHPLQEMTASFESQRLNLFTLRDAYRFEIERPEDRGVRAPSEWMGENPGYGADVNFWLTSAMPKGTHVTVQVLRGTHVIRTMRVADALHGINRVWWDLRYDDIKPVDGFVPWSGGGFRGPLVLPGLYTVRVSAYGSVRQTSLRVEQDPRSHASRSALREQLAFLLRIRNDLSRMTAAIDRLRGIAKKNASLAARATALLHEMYDPEVRQSEDALRYPDRVYGRLSFLAGAAASADAAPTQSERAVLLVLERRADALIARAARLGSAPRSDRRAGSHGASGRRPHASRVVLQYARVDA